MYDAISGISIYNVVVVSGLGLQCHYYVFRERSTFILKKLDCIHFSKGLSTVKTEEWPKVQRQLKTVTCSFLILSEFSLKSMIINTGCFVW